MYNDHAVAIMVATEPGSFYGSLCTGLVQLEQAVVAVEEMATVTIDRSLFPALL